ncbi:hypothetical protein BH09PAT2_BH09PAT2_07180 [soil metagenome]
MPDDQYHPAELVLDTEIKEPPARNGIDGHEEAVKFKQAVLASQQILFKAKSVFPFELFPDEIIIDENKIDIISKLFFQSQQVFSIPLSNVSAASSIVGLFMGSLSIEIKGLEQNPPVLKNLRRQDAIKARRMINGLVTAYKQGIDLKKLDLTQMTNELEQIGESQR